MYVFAVSSASVGWNDGLVRLFEGDVWRADDPFVKAHPRFFSSVPVRVHSVAGVVEQATAAPGEKRQTKR